MRLRLPFVPWLLLLLTHCGGQGPETGARPPHATTPTPTLPSNPGLPAFVISEVPTGTQGPVVAAHRESALAVWALQTDSGWRFRTALIQPRTGNVGAPVELGEAPETLELMYLRPLETSAYVLAYTHLDKDGGHQLCCQLLNGEGRALSSPVTLGVSSEALLWLDIVATPRGPLVFWASSRGDRADVRAAALDSHGEIRSAAHDVASDLRAWQVTSSPSAVALAAVRAVTDKPNGPIALLLLDDTAAPMKPPVAVTQADSAELDLDVAAIGDHFVLAWTDRQLGEARLYAAAVDTTATVTTAAHPLTAPLGDQSLVRILAAPGAAHGYLLWENLLMPGSVRKLQIASIDGKSQIGDNPISLSYADTLDHPPEITADAQGLSLIAPVPVSVLRQASAPAEVELDARDDVPTVPTFVSFSDKLRIRGVAPLLLASKPSIPSLAWGLQCNATDCFALGALSGESQVAVVGIPIAENARAGRSLLRQEPSESASQGPDDFDAKLRTYLIGSSDAAPRPRLAAVRVIADAEPLADLAVSSGEIPVVATLTYFDPGAPLVKLTTPAPDGRRDPLQARIDVRGPLGEPTSERSFISLRARSSGGLGWAVSANGKDKLLAWSALDQGQPQVFVTGFTAHGNKRAQRMITRGRANVTDVAAAPATAGYFVGWIDDQGQKSQAYVQQISPTFERQGTEHPISARTSVKTGLNLLTIRNELWAVWSDSEDAKRGRADLFLRRFSAADARPLGNEQRLFETPEHSYSPVLAASGADVVVAWMESEPRRETPESTTGVRIAKLDAEGRPGPTRAVQSPRGQITAFGFGCGPTACHLVVSVDLGGTGQIEAALVDPRTTAPIQTRPIIRSQGPADESVFPVVAGNDAYWVDHAGSKRVRVMRAAIEW